MKKINIKHKDDPKHPTYALCENLVVIVDHVPKLKEDEESIYVREVLKCEECNGVGLIGGWEGNPPEPVGYTCQSCSKVLPTSADVEEMAREYKSDCHPEFRCGKEEAFKAGHASRDAEVERYKRIEMNAAKVAIQAMEQEKEITRLKSELAEKSVTINFLRDALGKAIDGLRVCDIILKAAKPCVNGGYHMNEMAAEDAITAIDKVLESKDAKDNL